MKKKLFLVSVISVLFISLFVLTGCTKKHTVDDIKDYIENEIGITNYKLDKEPTEKQDDDDYTDYYWHVKYKEIEFDIIDDYYWGMESLTNTLFDNFNIKAMDYYCENYSFPSKIKYEQDYTHTKKNTLMFEVANAQKEIDEEELRQCYNNIVDFFDTIDFDEYPISNISIEIVNETEHVKWLNIYHNGSLKSFEEFKNQK